MNVTKYEAIIEMAPREHIFFEEPMSRHTTFRVGGAAKILIQIQSEEELAKMIPCLNRIEADYFILGNGSNLLISDKGYDGMILQMGAQFSDITVDGTKIHAQAGALLSNIAHVALENGLTGMEFASGIPGSIGGAVVMNAGAYDGEMKDIVTMVEVLDKAGNRMDLGKQSMEFSYRSSAIRNRPFLVTGVVLELTKGEPEQIKEKMKDFAKRRKEKQPLELPSAGSTFKRPDGYFAGKLIMDAGLRGFRIGGAQVSEKHCGFLVNIGNATASDLYELIQEVKIRVYNQFQVTLEPEVICLGEF